MVWLITLPIAALYMLAPGVLVGFFMSSPSTEAMTTGIQFLHILTPFYFVISFKLITDGVLRGAGMMREFMAGTFTDLILRVLLAIFFSRLFGSIGIWFAWPVGWSIATVISYLFYRNGPWK